MQESIRALSTQLEASLLSTTPARRLAFALWNSEFLKKRFWTSFQGKFGDAAGATLALWLDDVWRSLIFGRRATEESGKRASAVLVEIERRGNGALETSTLQEYGVVELIGCLLNTLEVQRSGSVAAAVQCAEHVVNVVDYELAFVACIKDPMSDRRIEREFHLQKQMMKHLATVPLLTIEERNRFR